MATDDSGLFERVSLNALKTVRTKSRTADCCRLRSAGKNMTARLPAIGSPLSSANSGVLNLVRHKSRRQCSRHGHWLRSFNKYEIGQILVLFGVTGISLTLGFSFARPDMYWYLIGAFSISVIVFWLGVEMALR
jgi:hypothetical protein